MLDVLIIGSGGAGLTAALKAKETGMSVVVVTKTLPTQAQTCMAQGGINAVIKNNSYRGLTPSADIDTIEAHIEDTLKSAHGLANKAVVEDICSKAPEAIEWLDRLGTPFSRVDGAKTPLESIAQRRLGGAGADRACYAQDYTGLKILHTLYDRCIEAGVEFVVEHYLLNLICHRGQCHRGQVIHDASETHHKSPDPASPNSNQVFGATFWDIRNGCVVSIEASHTIIATGGYGELYHGFTTNSLGSSGDGIAAVLRAGGVASDMEFVQFHPTALLDSSILISESARGEGGYLIDHQGNRFTDELAPRDEVARAIFAQLQAGHHVRLDIRHLGKEKLEQLMPQELHLCRLHAGLDPVNEPIPIMPVAHYTMGGIEVEADHKVKHLQNCYAIGECANLHLHGANRLGGNSLMEIIVSGINVVDTISKHDGSDQDSLCDGKQTEQDRQLIEKIFAKPNEVNFYQKRNVLGKMMYRDVGIIRHSDRLHEAEIYLDEIYDQLPAMGVGDKSRQNNRNFIEFLEFRNSIILAKCTLKSAILRQESRGAHYREDYPVTRDDWQKHIYCSLKGDEVEVQSQ